MTLDDTGGLVGPVRYCFGHVQPGIVSTKVLPGIVSTKATLAIYKRIRGKTYGQMVNKRVWHN